MEDRQNDSWEFLQKLYNDAQVPELELQGRCHDCKEKVNIVCKMAKDGKVEIDGGAFWHFKHTKDPFFKCEKCFVADNMLRDYVKTEVYSRVCGYLRPTRQWNAGKQSEWKERTVYDITEEDCK
jgi:hypothetical protein